MLNTAASRSSAIRRRFRRRPECRYRQVSSFSAGAKNQAGSDDGDTTSATYATVGGGYYNMASGTSCTVAGGHSCEGVGGYSLAAGRRAKASYDGTFVWADSNEFDFASTAVNEFSARATGGVRFVTAIDGSGGVTAGVALGPGDTPGDPYNHRNTSLRHGRPLGVVVRPIIAARAFDCRPEDASYVTQADHGVLEGIPSQLSGS